MRVLVINPNSSVAVTDGIADALAPLGAQFDVVRQEGGPETIRTDEHVAEAAAPLAARIAGAQADGYIIGLALSRCQSAPFPDISNGSRRWAAWTGWSRSCLCWTFPPKRPVVTLRSIVICARLARRYAIAVPALLFSVVREWPKSQRSFRTTSASR